MSDAREQFIALAKEQEAISREHPATYRSRVMALALLGYAYIGFILLLLLAGVGLIVLPCITSRHLAAWAFKGGIFLLAGVAYVLQSLFVGMRIPLPAGREITRREAPALFALIDDLQAALQVPPIDKVLLTDEFNASVAQLPRLGIFGWYRQYLLLGLPLLQALTPEQYRAVLAHEFGHLSRKHGAFRVWLWRVRETWGRLQESMSQGANALLFGPFLNWFGPRFMASTFVLARNEEYEADRHATELTSHDKAASALVTFELRKAFLDKTYWTDVTREMHACETPPSDPYSRMATALRVPMTTDFIHAELKKALLRQTDYDDTHPSLRDRLAGLGYSGVTADNPVLVSLAAATLTHSAADELLGLYAVDFSRELDAEWTKHAAPHWKEAFDSSCQARARLVELEAQIVATPPSKEEAWERAKLTAELGQQEEAIAQLRKLQATWPDYPPAMFGLGMLLLEQDDDAGMALINAAMHKDTDFIMPGCELLVPYLKAHGRDEEAEQYIRCGIQQYAVLEEAERKASILTAQDRFHPHELPCEEVESLQVLLADTKHAKVGYLVRKEIPGQPDRMRYLLGIVPGGFALGEETLTTCLLDDILARLHTSREVQVVILRGESLFLLDMMKKVPQALIYQKGKMPAGV